MRGARALTWSEPKWSRGLASTAAPGWRARSGGRCAMNQRLKEALQVCSRPCRSCCPTACTVHRHVAQPLLFTCTDTTQGTTHGTTTCPYVSHNDDGNNSMNARHEHSELCLQMGSSAPESALPGMMYSMQYICTEFRCGIVPARYRPGQAAAPQIHCPSPSCSGP